jgi:hypothetical protein
VQRIAVLEAKDGATMAMHRYWRVLDYKPFDHWKIASPRR